MNIYKNIKLIGLAMIAFTLITSCESEDFSSTIVDEVIPLSAGDADFSNYVSLGASFTSGFTDGALFIASQESSFPNLLAMKFAEVGGGDFSQPLMNDNNGGLLLGGVQIQNQRLYFDGAGPALIEGSPTTEVSNVQAGPYNNMGVPGAKSFHLLAEGYGNVAGVPTGQANPYFARMASSPNTSMLADAVSQSPSFFTLSEIGGNDVLSYATSGGSGVDQTGNLDPSTYGPNDITDPNVFAGAYSGIVNALTANGAKGVIANLPYITSLPFFTTVPYNPLDPTDENFGPQIPTLNATFAQLNAAYAFLGVPERSVVFSENAASAVVIHDEYLDNIEASLFGVLQAGGLDAATAGLLASQYGQSRQATAEELLVLTSSTIIGTLNQTYFDNLIASGVPAETAGQLSVNGITYPLEDQWVLLPQEQQAIQTATDAYNATIETVATAKGLAFVDFASLLTEGANSSIAFDDFNMTTQLVVGGLVSLDGIHLTSRGYAFMANKFLEAIDATYGSNFNVSNNLYKAVDFKTFYPASF